VYKSFATLTQAISAAVPVRDAILDGEIVHLDKDGTPQFYDLMRRRAPQHFSAFDLLWLGGRDLRELPLLQRKRLLRRIVPPQPSEVLYVDHLASRGVGLFAACERDLEGIVAKLANGPYTPEATTLGEDQEPQVFAGRGAGGLLSGAGGSGGSSPSKGNKLLDSLFR
jgi:ATP-dependent DNA ligase